MNTEKLNSLVTKWTVDAQTKKERKAQEEAQFAQFQNELNERMEREWQQSQNQ